MDDYEDIQYRLIEQNFFFGDNEPQTPFVLRFNMDEINQMFFTSLYTNNDENLLRERIELLSELERSDSGNDFVSARLELLDMLEDLIEENSIKTRLDVLRDIESTFAETRKKKDCTICYESKICKVTRCCSQMICLNCINSLEKLKCPYCRSKNLEKNLF